MAAERNFFHRWRGMTTIGYELGVIWKMSVYIREGLGSHRLREFFDRRVHLLGNRLAGGFGQFDG